MVIIALSDQQQNQIFSQPNIDACSLLDIGITEFYNLYQDYPVMLALHPEKAHELPHEFWYSWRGLPLFVTPEISKDEVYSFARMI